MTITLGIVLWLMGGFFFTLCTFYYFSELIPAYIRHRKRYLNQHVPSDEQILALLETKNQEFPQVKFQITTKGNEVQVIKRSIDSIVNLARISPLFEKNIQLLIVTDEQQEVATFSEYLHTLRIQFPVDVICVPSEYKTRNETELKARSLQYSLEYRKTNGNSYQNSSPSYIFYFDAESTIDETNFRRVIHSLLNSPDKTILEGPIVYPHKYFEANVLSRQMEATRPFNCHHCVQVMRNPPPLHLHGSNLLVEEKVVESIGWDFGKVKGEPLLAEDLMFGLKAYAKYGPQPFGWHGARICEQPPFSVRESINARMRWITGAWQVISLLKTQPEFLTLPHRKRTGILWRIRLRVLIHSLSFFAAFFVLLNTLTFIFPALFSIFISNPDLLSPTFRTMQYLVSRLIFLPGTVFWIFGVMKGATKNIELLNISRKQRFTEYGKLLLVTPISSAIESACVLLATIRWMIGKPYTKWKVTAK